MEEMLNYFFLRGDPDNSSDSVFEYRELEEWAINFYMDAFGFF